MKKGEYMHYLALACDYDGTLAKDGRVSQHTITAIERVVASGRQLLLVTGRMVQDLQRVFPRLDLFTYVVAENGAMLYQPASSAEKSLGEAPPESFIQALHDRGVPMTTGRVIVATWHPHETTVLEVIRELGLEYQVIFNKGSVMVLPTGVNKGTGLAAALSELHWSPHNVVGIGDAENDHSFLSMCECSVAVANALPSVKEQVDYTTNADHGDGVIELIEQLMSDDLQEIEQRTSRHSLLLGTKERGEPVLLKVRRTHALIAGPSGSGKSTLTTSLLEQLAAQAYQFCLIDPEGDYETMEGAITLGDPQKELSVLEMIQVLEQPEQSAIVNLLGSPLEDRPAVFRNLFPPLQDLHTRFGHPHWLIVDEAHHMFPPQWDISALIRVQELFSLLFITANPEHMSRQILSLVDTVIAVGADALSVLRAFSEAIGQQPPEMASSALESGEIVVWFRHAEQPPVRIRPASSRQEHRRHQRKYAEGNLGEDTSFYFRGPEGKLKLRAQNLNTFSQLAQGVDDATWLYHLRRGEYSRWFRETIKDEDLAKEAESIERDERLSAQGSRARIKSAIEQRYTLSI